VVVGIAVEVVVADADSEYDVDDLVHQIVDVWQVEGAVAGYDEHCDCAEVAVAVAGGKIAAEVAEEARVVDMKSGLQ
jgi:hypothetical protein